MADENYEIIEKKYGNKYAAISNALIQSREKTCLLESKIELLATYRRNDSLYQKQKTDASGKTYNVNAVKIFSKEIKELVDKKGGGIYSQIENVAFELKTKIYIYRDPKAQQFIMDNLYGEVTYENGILEIEYNPNTEYLFQELQSNYTKIPLETAFKFRTNGGFQLYKQLKCLEYTLPPIDKDLSQKEQKSVYKQYSYGELRLLLGYVDLNQKDIQKEGKKLHPDNDKLLEYEKKPKYKRWIDFYRRVIAPGIEEVNNFSDIYIEFETVKSAHGKIEHIIFYVQRNISWYLNNKENINKKNNEENNIVSLSEEELFDFLFEVKSIIKEKIPVKDLKEIALKANYDIDVIKKVNKIQKSYKRPINNLVGFYITAIEEEWSENKFIKNNTKTNSFNDFEQRNTDYDEIEDILTDMHI